MDRRTTLKWVLAASTSVPAKALTGPWDAEPTADLVSAYVPTVKGYGTDPPLTTIYRPGELWPLTLKPDERRTASVLSDLIIPADDTSPSASQVGVVDFLDEWLSAPYRSYQEDRRIILQGFGWLDRESVRRFRRAFVSLNEADQSAICDDICFIPKAKPAFNAAARFFARYRDLTAGGFYTTPEGRKDLQYVGNTPSRTFEGPPLDVLKKAGLL